MNKSSLPINRLVNVSVNLEPNAAQMQNISTLLILGTSNIIDIVERYRSYQDISAVTSDFGTTSEEYLAAALWFSQAPKPTNLLIGAWAKTAVSAILRGATLPAASQLLSVWTAITAGAFEIVIDNVPLSITGLNFSGATNLNGVASTIQTAIRAAATTAGATGAASISVVWNDVFSRFEIKSGTTGATASVMQFMNPPTATGFFNFSGNPTAADTITLNGTTVTFVAGAPAAGEVQIEATLEATLVSLLAYLKASADSQLVKFDYYHAGSYLYVEAATAGVGGNALTLAKSSTAITLSGATLAGAVATGDISSTIAMKSTSSGAYVSQGADAETAIDAVSLFDANYGQTWYGLTVPSASAADHEAIGSFIEATTSKHTYWISTQEAGALVAATTTDIASVMSAKNLNRTAVQFSSSNAYSAATLAAKALTINYNGNNTVIDLMYKQEPGIVAESLNATQVGALNAKNANVFLAYNNNTAIIEKGNMSNGVPIDIITGTDWLALDIQNSVYNLLYLSPTKIPQTDEGNHSILTVIESVLSQAVRNGLLAPGTWTSNGFGALNTGDFLPKGFYVFAPPIAEQNVADRAARKSVAFQIAAKLAGAIRTVDIQINVNR